MKETYTVNEISEALIPVLINYHINKAVLFGSYCKGTASENSDIDLLVDSGLSGLRFVGLIEDLREAIGKEIDLIDITHIEKSSKMEKEIMDYGVVIYER